MDLRAKLGDTVLLVALFENSDGAIDLTDAIVEVNMRRDERNSPLVISAEAATLADDPETGVATLTVQTNADDYVPGDYHYEFRALLDDESVITYPPAGYGLLRLEAPLGPAPEGE